MTLSAFLARYPEFGGGRAAESLIETCLAQASRAVSGDIWGSQLEDARGEYAAHLLATSSWGQQARLTQDGKTSTYGDQFERRQSAVIPRAFVSRF